MLLPSPGKVDQRSAAGRIKKVATAPDSKGLTQVVTEQMAGQLRRERQLETTRIKNDLVKAQVTIDKALTLLLADDIEADDYSKLKKQSERKIFELETELAVLSERTDIRPHIEDCLKVLEELPELFEESNAREKRQILRSILSEKLEFVEKVFQTLPLMKPCSWYTIPARL